MKQVRRISIFAMIALACSTGLTKAVIIKVKGVEDDGISKPAR